MLISVRSILTLARWLKPKSKEQFLSHEDLHDETSINVAWEETKSPKDIASQSHWLQLPIVSLSNDSSLPHYSGDNQPSWKPLTPEFSQLRVRHGDFEGNVQMGDIVYRLGNTRLLYLNLLGDRLQVRGWSKVSFLGQHKFRYEPSRYLGPQLLYVGIVQLKAIHELLSQDSGNGI